jgi:enoyl-CoA hydratase
MEFAALDVTLAEGIATIALDRPDQANAISMPMWHAIRQAFAWLDETAEARVGIITGKGRVFSAGIDLALLASVGALVADECAGRSREKLRRLVLDLQDTLCAIDRCRKPVLAAVNGACIGGGLDLVSACDMRYCSADAYFTIKEIDVGMTADLGTLQRLPRLIGEGMARELAYTGRKMDGAEAQQIGLVNRCYPTADALREGVRDIARVIASKSPLAVRGTKEMITYARDHPIADGLNYGATWNAAMLLSEDLAEAGRAARERRPPAFPD